MNASLGESPTQWRCNGLFDLATALGVGDTAKIDINVDGVTDAASAARATSDWGSQDWHFACEGAGLEILANEPDQLTVRRLRTLSDAIGPDLRVLCVGLNPSLTAADLGYGFASPSNRFWRAALAAELVTESKQPQRAVTVDGVGFTDLVKRATRAAAELRAHEFRDGVARLEWTTRLHRPRAVCVLGVTGWRHVAGKDATIGWQTERLGGRPVYVMPNPSGLNAHTDHDDLVAHLRKALAGDRP